MKIHRKCKKYIASAVVLTGAIGASAAVVSADFNSYTAVSVISSNTGTGGANILKYHGTLNDTDTNGAFTVWGWTGYGAASYSIAVKGNNTGSNYLNLNSTRVANNPLAQVSTTAARSLSENWGVSTRFSMTTNAGAAGNMFFGLYAGTAMDPNGGYSVMQIASVGNTAAKAALELYVLPGGQGCVARTGTGNALEYWDNVSHTWVSTQAFCLYNLDTKGTTEYDLAITTDGTDMNLSLINAGTSASLINVTSSLSALGSNITTVNTARFSAGDIGNDTTSNWDLNVQSISQIPEPATIGLIGFSTVGLLGIRKMLSVR